VVKPHRLGLVVGKFAPLHLGHELLIRRALSLADEVLIISYARPERPGCGPSRRRRWLRSRFPMAKVLVLDEQVPRKIPGAPRWPNDDEDPSLHRRFVGWLCHEVLGRHPDAVFSSEDYGPHLARELERYFRERGVPTGRVAHVAVDPARAGVPTSGSAVRADVHAHRHLLAPEVYASFVWRVAVVGGESSGKSTLCEALAAHFATRFVAEYGRTRWVEQRGRLEYEDLLDIARRQIELERAEATRADRYLFCDTTPLTTRFYSEDLFGRVDPELRQLSTRAYDLWVLCAPDFPFRQDGTRRDAAFRDRQHQFYLEALEHEPLLLVRGSVDERVAQVQATLTSHEFGDGLAVDPGG